MFSVGSMNGIGSINEPPDDNDSNAPNVTKVFFRDKMMENINVVVTIPRVDLLQQNLAQIEYEDDNPLKHMVILDESLFNELCTLWQDALVIKLLGTNIGFNIMREKLQGCGNSNWASNCLMLGMNTSWLRLTFKRIMLK